MLTQKPNRTILIFIGSLWQYCLWFSFWSYCRRTGAPNDICDSLTCNVTPCHDSYGLNTGKAMFSIIASSSYEKGKTTNIVVKFINSNTSLHGFEITAMDTTNTKVGTFASTNDTFISKRMRAFHIKGEAKKIGSETREDRNCYCKFERRLKMEAKKLPEYEMPKVTTYTDEEILEKLGPAQTGYVKDNAF